MIDLTDLTPLPLDLPHGNVVDIDDHNPEHWDKRREGLWIIADREGGKMLVLDAPEPGLVP